MPFHRPSRNTECGRQPGRKARNRCRGRGAERHKDRVHTRNHDTVQPWREFRCVNLFLFRVIVAFALLRIKVQILIFLLAGILIFIHLVLILELRLTAAARTVGIPVALEFVVSSDRFAIDLQSPVRHAVRRRPEILDVAPDAFEGAERTPFSIVPYCPGLLMLDLDLLAVGKRVIVRVGRFLKTFVAGTGTWHIFSYASMTDTFLMKSPPLLPFLLHQQKILQSFCSRSAGNLLPWLSGDGGVLGVLPLFSIGSVSRQTFLPSANTSML